MRQRLHLVLLAVLVTPLMSASLEACSSCGGDITIGPPGVVVDYSEVTGHHVGPVHVKSCFGSVCQEADSGGAMGSRIVIPLDNKKSPPAVVSFTATDPTGAVLLSTEGTFAVPSVSGSSASSCGTKMWQLNLVVHDATLEPTKPSEFTPEPTTTSSH
jgi:hypothetical protein